MGGSNMAGVMNVARVRKRVAGAATLMIKTQRISACESGERPIRLTECFRDPEMVKLASGMLNK